jgi:hypothetical protein
MKSLWSAGFAAVLILIWIVAGGFVTQANVFLHSHKGDDKNMKDAYWYSFAAAFITWFLVGLFLLVGLAALVGFGSIFGVSGVGMPVRLPTLRPLHTWRSECWR